MIPGLLLAAGTSSRMGQAKQLLDWRGQPLVRHVAQQALASSLDGLVVVVGYEGAAVRAALADLPVTFVVNEAYAEGQATSLRAGLAALPEQAEGVVVLLCDQPLVTPKLIDAVVAAFRAKATSNEQADLPVAVIPHYQNQRGNPVLLARSIFAELAQLRGDEGARGILRGYNKRVLRPDINDPAVVTDVDTVEESDALHSNHSGNV